MTTLPVIPHHRLWFGRALCVLGMGLALGRGALLLAAEDTAPRLANADLFVLLDPQYPGMAEIRRLGTGPKADPEAAAKAFAAHLRKRRQIPFSDALEFNAKRAADAAEGRIAGRTFPGGRIDWTLNLPGIPRTTSWSDLAAGYSNGKTAYAKAFVRQFQDWRTQNPVPSARSDGIFSTLEVGCRLGRSWTDAFQVFSRAPQVGDRDLLTLVAAMLEQASYLERHHSDATNWLINEMLGLYSVGAMLPEFKASAGWRKLALKLLDGNVARELLPDGAWTELTPGYGNWNSNNLMRVIKRAQDAGFADEIPATLTARIDQSYAWMIRIMAPDGRVPRLNDCSGWLEMDGGTAGWLLKSFPRNPTIAWAAKNRVGAAPPASAYYPDSGFMVMRSGWHEDATYVLFDTGPMGSSWHAHQDKLQVLLWSGGRELLMDNGGGPYNPEVPQRTWSRTSDSHNTVMVDGCGQARWRNRGRENEEDSSAVGVDLVPGDKDTPTPLFQTTQAWDYGCAWYQDAYLPSGRGDGVEQGPKPATHRREVVLIKPDLVVVVDTLTARDEQDHAYESRWHVPTTQRTLDATSDSIITGWDQGPNLAIIPLVRAGLTVKHASGVLKPEVLGWTYEQNRWQPALTVRHQGAPVRDRRFVTVFKILKPGETISGVVIQEPKERTYAAVVPDGMSVTVTLREGGGPGLEVRTAGRPLGSRHVTIEPPKPRTR